MRSLVIKNKIGFLTRLPFEIFDRYGNLFYSNEFTEAGKKLPAKGRGTCYRFNLPAGDYKYNGVFYKLHKPLKYPLIKIPKPERKYPFKRYKIVFKDNPNKCSIYYNVGLIIFDTQFKNAPVYQIYDIYYHELGHHFYRTEAFADTYASNKMLSIGFNPSQIGRASIETLSESQNYRKQIKVNTLKKLNYE